MKKREIERIMEENEKIQKMREKSNYGKKIKRERK